MFESGAGEKLKSDEGFEQTGSEGAFGGEARSERMGAAVWAEIRVPVVRPDGWPVHHLRMGLRELERLQREIDAARALLTGAMPESRDTVADIARNAGVSNREARRRKSVADVCGKVKGALEKLQSGTISNEHVSALAPVADMPGAASLLDDAASKSPEDLTRDVEEFRLSAACGNDMAKHQRARRSIRFFAGPEGMIGINGLLPPVEGTELKNRLAAIVDAKWRSEHPNRAKVLGGHGGDTHDQRMADALLAMAGVQSQSPEETHSSGAENCEAEQGSTTGISSTAGNSSTVGKGSTVGRGSEPVDSFEKDPFEIHSEETHSATDETIPDDSRLNDQSTAGNTDIPLSSTSDSASESQAPPKSTGEVARQGPPQAMSMKAGLRLVGLADTDDRELLRSASVANSPPAGSATTVKTGKPAVVIVFDVDQWKARMAGGSPIPITESLLDQARNDLYYCFQNMTGEVIKFGRSRRDPTPLQKLVLIVRDEKCLYPQCHAPPEACDAHHLNEVVKDRGRTDTDVMGLFCEAHHRHVHLNDLVVRRNPDGSITIVERRTGAVIASSNSKRAA